MEAHFVRVVIGIVDWNLQLKLLLITLLLISVFMILGRFARRADGSRTKEGFMLFQAVVAILGLVLHFVLAIGTYSPIAIHVLNAIASTLWAILMIRKGFQMDKLPHNVERYRRLGMTWL
ncbi:hypothetical protein C4544_00345 [candidate division WS5 bacterium]|uniref:Uncharacterized protein n=1 Tax=candidate division WS5 bacterium TaxID=2093353 RepID=A0A419DGN6_9BACT|nr:MAG: hypothetical protein C4544_00345 [candidate division WS5 bacterium]